VTNQELIAVLEAVPEKKLRLLELARELLGPDGSVDWEKCSTPPLVDEINEAEQEAHAYAEETRDLRCTLQKLLGP